MYVVAVRYLVSSNRVLEKLIFSRLVMKRRAIYGKQKFITICKRPTSKPISFKWSVPFRFTERKLTPVKGAQEVTNTRHTSDNKMAKNLLQPAAK